MELNCRGRHIQLNDIGLYTSSTSEGLKIGVHAAQEFIPLLGFQDLESAVKFVVRVNDLLENHLKHTNDESQMENEEIPEVFMRAFDADESS